MRKAALFIVLLLLCVPLQGQEGQQRVPPPATYTHATIAAMTARPAPDGSVHQTAGYTTAGVGAGTYIYHSTGRPTEDGGFYHDGPLADDYYELIDKSEANALQFGATCDTGDTDDLAAVQACIDAGVAHDAPIFLPSVSNGDYDISAPLWWTSTASSTTTGQFYTAHIRGGGMGVGGNGTVIRPTFTDRPATAIQLARTVVLRDLAIIGTNDAPNTAKDTIDDTYANYVDGDHRDSRYSPQCGIAIDPTLGTTPADGGYPSMTYLGETVTGSNEVYLTNVEVQKHVVNIIVRPDGQSNQNDTIFLDGCKLSRAAVLYAPCNVNTRHGASITNAVFARCHTAVDCLRYGAQSGRPPCVDGAVVGDVFRLIRASASLGNISWSNVYAEKLREIGMLGIGAAATNQTATFNNLELNLKYDFGREPFIASCFVPTTFVGCRFAQAGDSYGDVFNFQGTAIHFEGCAFMHASQTPRFIGSSSGSTVICTFNNCRKSITGGSAGPIGLPRSGATRTTFGARLEAIRQQDRFLYTQNSGLESYVRGLDRDHVNDSGSSYLLTDDILTWTAADATRYQLGDYLMASCRSDDGSSTSTVPAFVVTGIVGSAITATAFVDTGNIQATPSVSQITVEEWAPGQSLTGDTTSASPTILNLSPTTILEEGDWIKGTGIPTDARVTDITGTTVTLNKNATATASGVSLYYGRVHAYPTVGAGL